MDKKHRASAGGTMTTPRITTDPHKMGGMPVIRDSRIPAEMLARCIKRGYDDATIIEWYPGLEPEDLDAVRQWMPRAGKPPLSREEPTVRVQVTMTRSMRDAAHEAAGGPQKVSAWLRGLIRDALDAPRRAGGG